MFNTEDLISEIEKQPAIWNTVHDDYNNKSAKKAAWVIVVKHFTANFDDLDVLEKNNTVLGFQRKWKSLRDCFTRELLKKKKEKSGSSAVRKQYIYFKNLNFLQSLPKITSTGDDENSQDIQEDNLKEFPQIREEPEEPEITDSSLKKRPAKTKRKDTTEEDELFIMLRDKVLNCKKDDEDKLFMLSLVPELKRIPESDKLDLKIELMNVFKRARLRHCDPLDDTHEHEQQDSTFSQQMPHLKPMVESEQPWNIESISKREISDIEGDLVNEGTSDSSDISDNNL